MGTKRTLLSSFLFGVIILSFAAVNIVRSEWQLPALKISGGEDHTLVLTENKLVWGCGPNYSYQLGIGNDNSDQLVLVQVHDGDMNTASGCLENIDDIDAGWQHSLALDVNGFVWAWGNNSRGQLGDGSNNTRTTPVQVHDGDMNTASTYLENIIGISAGRSGEHSLAVDVNHFCWAWGRNSEGQLGLGDDDNRDVPHQIRGVNDVDFLGYIIAISAGERHSIAVDANGFVYTFGENQYGKTGIGKTTGEEETPVQVHGVNDVNYLENIVAVSAGWEHCMALEEIGLSDPNRKGRVYCWGRGTYGELGNGNEQNSSVPVLVKSGEQDPNDPNSYLENIIAISAGDYHSMALDINGNVWTWGENGDGQLGTGDNDDSSVPVKVVGPDTNGNGIHDANEGYLSNIVAISAGFWHCLAVDANGFVWSWGKGTDGRLGIDSTADKNIPQLVEIPVDIAMGFTKVDDVNDEDDVILDEYITYAICYDFNDPNYTDDIADVVITDVLPFEVDFYSASDGGDYDANLHIVTWDIGVLSPNDANCVTLEVIVNEQAVPLSTITNVCMLESNMGYTTATEDTNTGCWGEVLNVTKETWYCTIQDAIDDANEGNIIQIWPGTYYENLSFGSKSITLRGANPYNWNVVESTIIDTNSTSVDVITFNNSANSVLTGFTIKNGRAGIWAYSSTLKITNCVIEDNNFWGTTFRDESSVHVENCKIRNNSYSAIDCQNSDANVNACLITDNRGGLGCSLDSFVTVTNSRIQNNGNWNGITCASSQLNVNNSIIQNNHDYGIYFYSISAGSTSTLKNNWICDNDSYGIFLWDVDSVIAIRNNTVVNNSYGIIRMYGGIAPNISNCIIWGNGDDLSGCSATYSCIQDGDGGSGNIDDDPCFMNTSDPNNYHLSPDSLCIDAGDPNADYGDETDIDGEDRVIYGRVDIGGDEYYWSSADYDESGYVDFIDYAMFADTWQTEDANITLDDDNDVDTDDLALFCEDWLWQAGWIKTFTCGCGAGGGFGLEEGLYSTMAAKQQPVEIEPVDVEELIKWLEEIWLNGDLEGCMTEEEYLEFIESVKSADE